MTLVKAEHFIIVGPMPFIWNELQFVGNSENTIVIFIDGGVVHLRTFKKKAKSFLSTSVIIGDGDSTSTKMQIKKIDQNLSDLAYCLKTIKPFVKNTKSFSFLGFLGIKNTLNNRLDHLLFNISEIFAFTKSMHFSGNPIIKMEDNVFFFKKGSHKIQINSLFSYFSLEKSIVKIGGQCLYKTSSVPILPLSSRGLSNEGMGLVRIESSKTFCLILSR